MRKKIALWRVYLLMALFSLSLVALVGCDSKVPTAEKGKSLLASKKGDLSMRHGVNVAENINDLAKWMYKDEVWTYLNSENPISHELEAKYFRAAGTVYIQGVADSKLTKEPPVIVLKDGTRVWVRNAGDEDWPEAVTGKRIIASGRVYRSEAKFAPGAPMLPGRHEQSYDFELDQWDLEKP